MGRVTVIYVQMRVYPPGVRLSMHIWICRVLLWPRLGGLLRCEELGSEGQPGLWLSSSPHSPCPELMLRRSPVVVSPSLGSAMGVLGL